MLFDKITTKLFAYFVRGLLLLTPLFFTFYILFAIFNWLDSKFYFFFPGAGILTVVLFIILIGWIGSTFITQPVIRMLEAGLSHLPLVRIIYFSIKDLVSAFVGDKKKFDHAVLVKMNRESEIHKIGFITQTDLSALGINEYVSVYFPHSYAFSGELYIVPAGNITEINLSASDAMKFIVSGGVA
jgi:uncharacterized membrane protein